MCFAIKVVYLGCDSHIRHIFNQCKGGKEWTLNMRVVECCNGVRVPEDWLMSRCPFCEEYFQSRKVSGPRTRAASISIMEGLDEKRRDFVASSIVEEPVTTREKASIKPSFLPYRPK